MAVQTFADVAATERTPLAARALPDNTYAALQACAKVHCDSLALRYVPDVHALEVSYDWTYAELLSDITRAANALHDLGVRQDDVVAFLLPSLPETHFVIWGAEAAGVVMAINPLLEVGQITELLRAANARVVVTLAPAPGVYLWEKLANALDQLPSVTDYIWVSSEAYARDSQKPLLRTFIQQQKALFSHLRIHDLRQLLSEQSGQALKSGRVIGAGDVSSLFCTGGTTGAPKIAMRTHRSEVCNAWSMSENLQPQAPGQVYFCGLPLFHVNGQLVTGLMPWTRGDSVLIGTAQGYRGEGVLENFWALVEHYQINFFSGVPTVYSSLLQHAVGGRDISSLKYALCGAAPMPVELFYEFERTLGVHILEGYGLTEGACVSSSNPAGGERRVGSIGIRLPYQQMRAVVLNEQGNYLRDAKVDEVGVIVIQGPNVFAGYVESAHNEGIWVEIESSNWLNTGDLGREDAQHYFWLTGRKKELIIRGGHNIDPKQIEEALQTHPDVVMCAAVGSPDVHSGEVPVAYVQLRQGASSTDQDLLSFVAGLISERAAIPKRIEILPALPVTAIGKIFKPTLQQWEVADAIRAEAMRLGLENVVVDVAQDKRRGLLARIGSQGSTELRQAIGKYTFNVEWLN